MLQNKLEKQISLYNQTISFLLKSDQEPISPSEYLLLLYSHGLEIKLLSELQSAVGEAWFDISQDLYPPTVIALFDSFLHAVER